MRYSRTNRISEEIRKIVSNIIMNELKDPRVSKLTSITKVETTNDLRYTNIFISVFDDKQKMIETNEALNKAKGFIRKELGKKLNLRYIPEPIFKLDESIKQGIYMSKLIDKVNKNIDVSDEEDPNND